MAGANGWLDEEVVATPPAGCEEHAAAANGRMDRVGVAAARSHALSPHSTDLARARACERMKQHWQTGCLDQPDPCLYGGVEKPTTQPLPSQRTTIVNTIALATPLAQQSSQTQTQTFQCGFGSGTCSQNNMNMDATDDFIASVIAGGPVTSLV